MRERNIEIAVGLFLLIAIFALLMLAFQVSGLSHRIGEKTYLVTADFDNVGGLKPRSQVTIAGVRIGEVIHIRLDKRTFRARVTMRLFSRESIIPSDSSAMILTEGLLGANYISLTPGFADTYLKDGGRIEETHSALVLENLIGQFIFNSKSKDEKEPEKKEISNEN